MKQVIVAKSAGFCTGVAHSVALAERELSAGTPLWCLGELIHNRDEVARLCAMGMRIADTVEEIPEGSAVLLRSHGVGKAVYDALERRRCRIIDGTCGRVKYIHRIAECAQAEGKSLIVFGQADHPEVQGICGWCADSSVAQSVEELECLLHKCSELNNRGTVVVFQSTETQEHLKKSKEIQKKICTNAEIFDTICDATQIRQSEALDFGQKCDAVVVIGSPQTYDYLRAMQTRVSEFVTAHSHISRQDYDRLLNNTSQLANDVGSILNGGEAVKAGLIDAIGTLSDALAYLHGRIETGSVRKEA